MYSSYCFKLLLSLDKEIWILGNSCIRKLIVEADCGDFPDETFEKICVLHFNDAKYKLQWTSSWFIIWNLTMHKVIIWVLKRISTCCVRKESEIYIAKWDKIQIHFLSKIRKYFHQKVFNKFYESSLKIWYMKNNQEYQLQSHYFWCSLHQWLHS